MNNEGELIFNSYSSHQKEFKGEVGEENKDVKEAIGEELILETEN